MEFREILLVIHIAAVGAWLGANVVQMVVPGVAAKQGVPAAAGWYRVAAGFGTKVYMPASILVLLSGILLVLQDDAYGFGSLFVTIGFAMIILGIVLGVVVYKPGSERAAEAIESEDQGRIKAAVGRLAAFGTVDTLLLLFTITAMVLRLGA